MLLAISLAFALVAPAKAQQITAADVTGFAAALVGYDTRCAKLGPRAHELMIVMTSALNPTDAVAAALNTNVQIESWGVGKWCATMKDVVDMTERGGR
jgi:hypothetical protein